MVQNTSISLDDHFLEFLSSEVSSGPYRSASEVVRAGLRLLEVQETQLSALRAALDAGEASGGLPVRLRRVYCGEEDVSGFRLTPAAQRDLSLIWDYSEENWGEKQAEKYNWRVALCG